MTGYTLLFMPKKRLLLGAFLLVALKAAEAAMSPTNVGLPAVDNVYGRNGVPGANASSACISCHSSVLVPGRGSHFVAHFSAVDGALRTTTPANQAAKERTTAWTTSGALSRYGKNLSTAPASDNVSGEIICESCHNMTKNAAGGNNLVESSQLIDVRPGSPPGSGNDLASPTTTLCEGCHVSPTLPGHHAMTGETVSDGTPFSNVDNVLTRGFVSISTEMGGSGSEVFMPAANALACISCHGNGHNGYQGTGARILRRGFGGPATPAPGSAVAGSDNTGLDRQADFDPVGTNRMIGNFTPLCDACHKADD